MYLEIRPLANEDMSFKGFSSFSSGSHFVQQTGIISTILVEGHPVNISVKLFSNQAIAFQDMSFKSFSIFSSGGHFVQLSRTILANLVEGQPRNISVKLF